MKKETLDAMVKANNAIVRDIYDIISDCNYYWNDLNTRAYYCESSFAELNDMHKISRDASKLTVLVPILFRKLQALRQSQKILSTHDTEQFGEYPVIQEIYDVMDSSHIRCIIDYLDLTDLLP